MKVLWATLLVVMAAPVVPEARADSWLSFGYSSGNGAGYVNVGTAGWNSGWAAGWAHGARDMRGGVAFGYVQAPAYRAARLGYRSAYGPHGPYAAAFQRGYAAAYRKAYPVPVYVAPYGVPYVPYGAAPYAAPAHRHGRSCGHGDHHHGSYGHGSGHGSYGHGSRYDDRYDDRYDRYRNDSRYDDEYIYEEPRRRR